MVWSLRKKRRPRYTEHATGKQDSKQLLPKTNRTAIKKKKDVGRKALTAKLSSRLGIYHDMASALDLTVGGHTDETKRQKIFDKIEFVHERITGWWA